MGHPRRTARVSELTGGLAEYPRLGLPPDWGPGLGPRTGHRTTPLGLGTEWETELLGRSGPAGEPAAGLGRAGRTTGPGGKGFGNKAALSGRARSGGLVGGIGLGFGGEGTMRAMDRNPDDGKTGSDRALRNAAKRPSAPDGPDPVGAAPIRSYSVRLDPDSEGSVQADAPRLSPAADALDTAGGTPTHQEAPEQAPPREPYHASPPMEAPVAHRSTRSEQRGPAQGPDSGAIPYRSDAPIRSGNALEREARLAAALRDNLRRRKTAARGRVAAALGAAPSNDAEVSTAAAPEASPTDADRPLR